jgi:hypothetical protein
LLSPRLPAFSVTASVIFSGKRFQHPVSNTGVEENKSCDASPES